MNKNFLVGFTFLMVAFFGVQTQAQAPHHHSGGDSTQHHDTMVITKATGTISGVVTSEADGLPIPGAKVALASESAHNGHCPGAEKRIVTDSLGAFSTTVDTGTYVLKFSAKGYTSEYYDNASSVSAATKVTVAENVAVSASAALAMYVAPITYTLQGSVKDSSGNAMKAKISIFKLQDNTFHIDRAEAKTDSLGAYAVKVNSGDTIVVFAQPADHKYASEYYNNQKDFAGADRIAISSDVTGIDFVLDLKPVLPNGISGVVTDSAGATVQAHIKAIKLESGKKDKKYVAVSDSLGTYSLTNLSPGTYILEAIPESGYAATYFKYDGSTTLIKSAADSVVVDSTTVVTGINFTVKALLDSGLATVSGTIRNQNNASVSDAIVYAINSSNKVASYAIVSINGRFVINNLLPGTYTIATSSTDYSAVSNPTITLNYTTSAYKTTAVTVNEMATTNVSNENTVVSGFNLAQNYPNPFNPSTIIKFSLPEKMNVKLTVYDLMGREVAQLVSGINEAGTHSVEFNGAGLSSGVYFYTLTGNNLSLTHKFVLMK